MPGKIDKKQIVERVCVIPELYAQNTAVCL